ncbi:hypothetical protein SRHO_G00243540 [Serrasalmus rhombeus]
MVTHHLQIKAALASKCATLYKYSYPTDKHRLLRDVLVFRMCCPALIGHEINSPINSQVLSVSQVYKNTLAFLRNQVCEMWLNSSLVEINVFDVCSLTWHRYFPSFTYCIWW